MSAIRVLLVHLASNGDCLMATTVARQIKADYPGCFLTWAISCKCRQVIDNNPYVDNVCEVEFEKGELTVWDMWRRVRLVAETKRKVGEYDHVFYTQIYPDNVSNFDGTTRSSTFRNYPHPITVPVTPVLRLREDEIEHVRLFVSEKMLEKYRHVILFECSPGSGQSSMDLHKGVAVSEKIVGIHSDAIVVISTHIPFVSPHPRIVDGSCLSFRENVALSHFCTFLVGCSSGITWLLTSDSAKTLRTVQFLSRKAMAGGFASVVYDFQHWGLSFEHILESDAEDACQRAQVVSCALDNFQAARIRYHCVFRPVFWDFLLFFDYHSVRGALRIFRTCRFFVDRNHMTWRDVVQVNCLWRVICCMVRRLNELTLKQKSMRQ